jgi:hypothetical protein
MKVTIDVPDEVYRAWDNNRRVGRDFLSNLSGVSKPQARIYAHALKHGTIHGSRAEPAIKAVLLFDIHYDDHNKKAIELILQFIPDYKPNLIALVGDCLGMPMFSYYDRGKPQIVGRPAKPYYDGFNRDILLPLEAAAPEADMVFFIGNHEDRVNRYVEEYPKTAGMIEPWNYLQLKERGYDVVPRDGYRKYGKLVVIHGNRWNKLHTSYTVNEWARSVCQGHAHTMQSFTAVTAKDHKDYHAAWSMPCLSNPYPEYQKGRPNHWVVGFGVLEVLKCGCFNLYPILINNGKFSWDGRVYE